MKRLLLPLLAAIALPTSVNAERSEAEKQLLLYFGGAHGTATTLCNLVYKNVISIDDAKKYKKFYFSVYDGLNIDGLELSSARTGFDVGLSNLKKNNDIYKKKCNF